jgi:hypothetical protein
MSLLNSIQERLQQEPQAAVRQEEPRLRRLAIHEAGHSVAALIFGVTAHRAWLEINDAGNVRGWSRTKTASWKSVGPYARLIYVLGGEAADKEFCDLEPNLQSQDRIDARRLAAEVDPENVDGVIEAAWNEALALVRHHSRTIRSMARWLYDQGELEETQIRIMHGITAPEVNYCPLPYRSPKERDARIRQILKEMRPSAPEAPKAKSHEAKITRRVDGYLAAAAGSASDDDWNRKRTSWADSRTMEYLRAHGRV